MNLEQNIDGAVEQLTEAVNKIDNMEVVSVDFMEQLIEETKAKRPKGRLLSKKDFHYQLISIFYEGKAAKRSGVPYMKHIDEGLKILAHELDADKVTQQAFCIHPIVQDSESLKWFMTSSNMGRCHELALVLAMEYRSKANAYLCRPRTDRFTPEDLPAITIPEVKQMLIADKIQNYSDFLTHHYGAHERSKELDNYFETWLVHLGVEPRMFKEIRYNQIDRN